MQKGFNSDVIVHGSTYHVQTEDWGNDNPYLVSRIYLNGAVIRSFKTAYDEALPVSPVRAKGEAIQWAMREQHQKILDLLVSGKLHGF